MSTLQVTQERERETESRKKVRRRTKRRKISPSDLQEQKVVALSPLPLAHFVCLFRYGLSLSSLPFFLSSRLLRPRGTLSLSLELPCKERADRAHNATRKRASATAVFFRRWPTPRAVALSLPYSSLAGLLPSLLLLSTSTRHRYTYIDGNETRNGRQRSLALENQESQRRRIASPSKKKTKYHGRDRGAPPAPRGGLLPRRQVFPGRGVQHGTEEEVEEPDTQRERERERERRGERERERGSEEEPLLYGKKNSNPTSTTSSKRRSCSPSSAPSSSSRTSGTRSCATTSTREWKPPG